MPALTLVATEYEMLGQMARIMSALRVLRPAYAGMEKSDRQVFLKSLWGEVAPLFRPKPVYTGPIPAIARSLYAEYKKAQTSKHFDLGAVSQDDPRADEFAGGVAGWVMPALVEPVDGRWWDKYAQSTDADDSSNRMVVDDPPKPEAENSRANAASTAQSRKPQEGGSSRSPTEQPVRRASGKEVNRQTAINIPVAFPPAPPPAPPPALPAAPPVPAAARSATPQAPKTNQRPSVGQLTTTNQAKLPFIAEKRLATPVSATTSNAQQGAASRIPPVQQPLQPKLGGKMVATKPNQGTIPQFPASLKESIVWDVGSEALTAEELAEEDLQPVYLRRYRSNQDLTCHPDPSDFPAAESHSNYIRGEENWADFWPPIILPPCNACTAKNFLCIYSQPSRVACAHCVASKISCKRKGLCQAIQDARVAYQKKIGWVPEGKRANDPSVSDRGDPKKAPGKRTGKGRADRGPPSPEVIDLDAELEYEDLPNTKQELREVIIAQRATIAELREQMRMLLDKLLSVHSRQDDQETRTVAVARNVEAMRVAMSNRVAENPHKEQVDG